MITETETLYTSPIEPSIDEARSVLAFLLLSARAFLHPGDDLAQMRAVGEVLRDYKRDILLRWYARAMRRCG